jgi:pentatricopeptide repeat protein
VEKVKKKYKNPEFHADFESVEKVFKKMHKQSCKQNKFDEHE